MIDSLLFTSSFLFIAASWFKFVRFGVKMCEKIRLAFFLFPLLSRYLLATKNSRLLYVTSASTSSILREFFLKYVQATHNDIEPVESFLRNFFGDASFFLSMNMF